MALVSLSEQTEDNFLFSEDEGGNQMQEDSWMNTQVDSQMGEKNRKYKNKHLFNSQSVPGNIFLHSLFQAKLKGDWNLRICGGVRNIHIHSFVIKFQQRELVDCLLILTLDGSVIVGLVSFSQKEYNSFSCHFPVPFSNYSVS